MTGFFPHSLLLLAASAVTVETTGAAFEITLKAPSPDATNSEWGVLAKLTQANTGTGKLYIEISNDKTNWFPIVMCETDAAETEVKVDQASHVTRYLRGRVVPTGSAALTARLELVGTAAFSGTAQA